MGKIKKGILGGFSGRVGNVIGGSWKGIDYMRSEATSIIDPKTAKQLEQRSKFRVAVEFAKQVVPVINIGLKQYATKRSEFNYLVSKICKDWWDDVNDNINFPLVQLSAGELPTEQITAVRYDDGSVLLDWVCENPSYDSNYVFAVVCNTEYGSVFYEIGSDSVVRGDETIGVPVSGSIDLIYCWCYLFFYDPVTGNCSATTSYLQS